MSEDFTVVDLNRFNLDEPAPPGEAFSKDPIEVEPADELGFHLTGMQSSKFQRAVGVPPSGKQLRGVLWGYGMATFSTWNLARMAAEDRLHLGGVPAPLSQEHIKHYDEDLVRRPEIRTQVQLIAFPTPPALELVFTVSSYFWSPEDSWVQFFVGGEMIGRIFIGGRDDEKTYQVGFRLVNVPNKAFMVHSRLATEVVTRGFMLFDGVELRVREE